MNLLAGFLLLLQAYISLEFAGRIFLRESTHRREDAVLVINLLTVAVWSLSWLALIHAGDDQENLRYAARNLSVLSGILTVCFCHYIVMRGISLEGERANIILKTELALGLLIFPFTVAREAVIFEKGVFGWSYALTDYSGNALYSLYRILVELVMLAMSIRHMERKKAERTDLWEIRHHLCGTGSTGDDPDGGPSCDWEADAPVEHHSHDNLCRAELLSDRMAECLQTYRQQRISPDLQLYRYAHAGDG